MTNIKRFESELREVLMIAYHYAPLNHTSTRRATAFARYLPRWGYRPTVLTTNVRGCLPTDDAQRVVRTTELLNLIRQPLRKLQLGHLSPAQRANTALIDVDSWPSRFLHTVLIPDACITWYPFAVRRGYQLLHERPIRLIFSSSPPATSHLVALRLKRLTGLPWVADFRDGWMFEPPNPAPYQNRFRTRLEHALEQRVILTVDHIVTVNHLIADDFIRRYSLPPERMTVISNGYEPEMFVGIKRTRQLDQRFCVVHTGSLSSGESSRSIEGFISALKSIHNDNIDIAKDLQVIFVGDLTRQEQELIYNFGLSSYVIFTGVLPYNEAIQYQFNADALLLVTANSAISVTTNKLFEYLAVGRPILALTGQSHAASLIRELDAGLIVAPDDVEGIKQAICTLHARWQANDLPSRNDPRVERFSRPELTRQLAQCFDELLNSSIHQLKL